MSKTATIHAQQKWENKVLTSKTDNYLIQEANLAGQEGWEVLTVLQIKDRKGDLVWSAFLKRPYVVHGMGPVQATPAQPEAAPPEEKEHEPAPPQTVEESDFDDEDIHFKEE